MPRPNLSSTARYIAWHARQTPDSVALFENGWPITYGSLAADLVRCMGSISNLGVRPGMLVGVESNERYLHLLLVLACEVVGAATTALSPGEEGDIAGYCDVILCGNPPAAVNRAKAIAIPRAWGLGLPGSLSGEPVAAWELTVLDQDIEPNRVSKIITTSGTSGKPKAMAVSFAMQQLRIARTIEVFPPAMPERPGMLCLYHLSLGLVQRRAMAVLQLGGTVFLPFSGPDGWALIAAGAIHYAVFAVGDLARSLGIARPPPDGHPLHIWAFGARLSPALRRQVRTQLRAGIENAYSLNEAPLVAVTDENDIGTLGPGVEVLIAGDDGRNLGYGETGMILVRTDTMVPGYFNDPALTEAAFIDGWYKTNDIGFMPEPGRLVVLGRADAMLNIGGLKVPPGPVEARVKAIDGVSDAVALSVTNENAIGTLLMAVEVESDPSPGDLISQIEAILSDYVKAFSILPMRRLPRTKSGKIRLPEIEAAFRDCGTSRAV